MERYIKIMILLAFFAVNVSCESWLDVQPVDSVSEEQLFETESGFMQALNGVYVEMNQSSLYGGELLFNAVEILAQRYQFSSAGEQAGYYQLGQFNYTSDYAEEVAENIWKEAYALILNVNKIFRIYMQDSCLPHSANIRNCLNIFKNSLIRLQSVLKSAFTGQKE